MLGRTSSALHAVKHSCPPSMYQMRRRFQKLYKPVTVLSNAEGGRNHINTVLAHSLCLAACSPSTAAQGQAHPRAIPAPSQTAAAANWPVADMAHDTPLLCQVIAMHPVYPGSAGHVDVICLQWSADWSLLAALCATGDLLPYLVLPIQVIRRQCCLQC